MGYATFIQVNNDAMHEVVKHPDDVADALRRLHLDGGVAGVGNHANALQVIRCEHTSNFQLVGSLRGAALALSEYDTETMRVAEFNPQLLRDMVTVARRHLDGLEAALDKVDSAAV